MYLAVDIDKCTGCRSCESICSLRWEREVRPSAAAVTVVAWEERGLFVPTVCQQCERASCVEVCVARALVRDPVSGSLKVERTRCVGCKMCVTACPYGGMGFDFTAGISRKCDLCEGKPRCALICPSGAIEYVAEERLAVSRRRSAMERLLATSRTNFTFPGPGPSAPAGQQEKGGES